MQITVSVCFLDTLGARGFFCFPGKAVGDEALIEIVAKNAMILITALSQKQQKQQKTFGTQGILLITYLKAELSFLVHRALGFHCPVTPDGY